MKCELAFVFLDRKTAKECYTRMKEIYGKDNSVRLTNTGFCIILAPVGLETGLLIAQNYGLSYEKNLRRIGINGIGPF